MKLLMVAGELSGDTHGGSILTYLREILPDLQSFGMGGSRMIDAGLECLRPIQRLQARGVVEVLRQLPRHFRYLSYLNDLMDRERPDAVLLIDYPGFNLKVAKAAKTRGIPVLYYSGPQVWAWRGGRMRRIVRWVDKMMVLFPFEVPLYREAGVDAVFLGHPLVGQKVSDEEAAEFRSRAAPVEGLPVVAVMPGSRPSELTRNLPPMLEGLKKIQATGFAANFVLPLASTLDRARTDEMVRESGVNIKVLEGAFLPLLRIADLAVVASGTATLQVGMAGIPFVVVYRVSALTYQIVRCLKYVNYISIVNILAGKEIAPELIQGDFTPENLSRTFLEIANDAARQTRMREALAEVTKGLGEPGAYRRAAELIAEFLKNGGSAPPEQGATSV